MASKSTPLPKINDPDVSNNKHFKNNSPDVRGNDEIIMVYRKTLSDAEARVNHQFDFMTTQVKSTLIVHLFFYILTTLFSIAVTICGIYLLFTINSNPQNTFSGIGLAFIGSLALIQQQNKYPISQLKDIFLDITETNMVFMAFAQQLHQLEIVYAQECLKSDSDVKAIFSIVDKVQHISERNARLFLEKNSILQGFKDNQ